MASGDEKQTILLANHECAAESTRLRIAGVATFNADHSIPCLYLLYVLGGREFWRYFLSIGWIDLDSQHIEDSHGDEES